ncbi:hypothetical protein D3C84_1188320 [compost metagenome]
MLPNEIKDHINEILEAYGDFSGVQLENMTHAEAPWIKARGNLRSYERCENEIDEELMREFYAQLLKTDVK